MKSGVYKPRSKSGSASDLEGFDGQPQGGADSDLLWDQVSLTIRNRVFSVKMTWSFEFYLRSSCVASTIQCTFLGITSSCTNETPSYVVSQVLLLSACDFVSFSSGYSLKELCPEVNHTHPSCRPFLFSLRRHVSLTIIVRKDMLLITSFSLEQLTWKMTFLSLSQCLFELLPV